METILIRHGKTFGNILKRYIGVTDEELSLEGIEEIKSINYPKADRIISSPMKRCIQTAKIIYGNLPIEIFPDLKECNFGDFENKSYNDLKDDPYYIKWLESSGTIPFPNGETHEHFCKRCVDCFNEIINANKAEKIAFVVHGGTVMAVMHKYFGGNFYDYHIKNGEFYTIRFTSETIPEYDKGGKENGIQIK